MGLWYTLSEPLQRDKTPHQKKTKQTKTKLLLYFSDESKFLLIGSDGKTYVRRKVDEELSPKCLKASVKLGGGSVMVWGMISGDGVGSLVRLQGKVRVYKQLVKGHVLPVLREPTKQPSIFIQDNAPCQKAMVVMMYT